MGNFYYPEFMLGLGNGEFDLENDDLRALLVMTNTTLDTDLASRFVGDFATLDECDGANYARKSLVVSSWSIDVPNVRTELIVATTVWSALGVGNRQNQAAIVYKHVTNDADSPVIAYIDTGGFPFDGSGADFSIDWNAEGLLQFKTGT